MTALRIGQATRSSGVPTGIRPFLRRTAIGALALVSVLATVSAASAAIKCPIRLGNVRSETGASAAYGQSLVAGLKMGFDEVNAKGGVAGCKVELVTYDSQSLPANAATLTQRLLYQDGITFILGSSMSLEALAMMEITEGAGVPLYVASAASAKITTQGGKWIWRQSIVDLNAAKFLAGYLADKGWKKIGVMFENTDYGKLPVNNVLLPELKARGIEVTAVDTFNTGDSDLSSPLLRMRDSGAEKLIFWGRDKEGALAMRQMLQLGMNMPVASNTGVVYPNFLDLLPAEVQNKLDFIAIAQFVWTSEDPKLKAWIDRYKTEFNKLPDATSIDGYDAAFVLKKAIESAGDLSPAAMKKALTAVSYDAVGGGVSFDATGQARRPMVIVKMTPKDGVGYRVIETINP
jgi:branched-chain amino acid transport system substrate-binding protein